MYVIDITAPTAPTLSAILPLGLTGERTRLGPHRQLRQERLLAGVGGRRRQGRGRRPLEPGRAALARQVRVGRLAERRVPRHPRHRARLERARVVGRRRRRCGLQADGEPARAGARRQDRRRGPQPVPLQRLHPPQLAAAREDPPDHRGGLHRHGRGAAGRLPRPGQVRDLGSLPARQAGDHAARHLGDRAERDVHERCRRLEGPGDRQLLLSLVRRQGRGRGGRLVRAGRPLPRLPHAHRHPAGGLLHPGERLDLGRLLVADRPERRDRLRRRRVPRDRRAPDREGRPDREEGQGAGAGRVDRGRRHDLELRPPPRLRLHVPRAPGRRETCPRARECPRRASRSRARASRARRGSRAGASA